MEMGRPVTARKSSLLLVVGFCALTAGRASPAHSGETAVVWRATLDGEEALAEWFTSEDSQPRMPAMVLGLSGVPAILDEDGTVSGVQRSDHVNVHDVSSDGRWAAVSLSSKAERTLPDEVAWLDSGGHEVSRLPIPEGSGMTPYGPMVQLSDDGWFLIFHRYPARREEGPWGACGVFARTGEKVFASGGVDFFLPKRFVPDVYCLVEMHDSPPGCRYVSRNSAFAERWSVPLQVEYAQAVRDHFLLPSGHYLLVLQESRAPSPPAVRFVIVEAADSARTPTISADTTIALDDPTGDGVHAHIAAAVMRDGLGLGNVIVAHLVAEGGSGVEKTECLGVVTCFSSRTFRKLWSIRLGRVGKFGGELTVVPALDGRTAIVLVSDLGSRDLTMYEVSHDGELVHSDRIPDAWPGGVRVTRWVTPRVLMVQGQRQSVALSTEGPR